MGRIKTRSGTVKFDDNVDMQKANEFLKKWESFGVYIGLTEGFDKNLCNDRQTFISGALEGIYKAFVKLMHHYAEPWDEKLVRTVIRGQIKRNIYDMCIINGYLPSRGQVFFPKGWVNWEDYFQLYESNNDITATCELNYIESLIEELPDKDRDIMRLFAAGYDCAEISRRSGYKNKSAGLKRVYSACKTIQKKLGI